MVLGTVWLVLHSSPELKGWQLYLFAAFAGNGICWVDTVCYLLCIKSFASRSRVAVSLALSTKVYTNHQTAGRDEFMQGSKAEELHLPSYEKRCDQHSSLRSSGLALSRSQPAVLVAATAARAASPSALAGRLGFEPPHPRGRASPWCAASRPVRPRPKMRRRLAPHFASVAALLRSTCCRLPYARAGADSACRLNHATRTFTPSY
ncbi:hypothetical protein ZWY2020_036576 [Hordeum vulgare]|nr:hypothetical protein ZWY2020_036576 [Hordeum vulgare]